MSCHSVWTEVPVQKLNRARSPLCPTSEGGWWSASEKPINAHAWLFLHFLAFTKAGEDHNTSSFLTRDSSISAPDFPLMRFFVLSSDRTGIPNLLYDPSVSRIEKQAKSERELRPVIGRGVAGPDMLGMIV
jgi:hypothetical protein